MKDQTTHALSVEEVLRILETHLEKGLTSQEAEKRLKRYGFNELREKPHPTFFQRVKLQFNNFLIRLLVVAAVVSLCLGEFVDAGAIIAIVVINSLIGVIQEMKADRAITALKKMAAPSARVIRDGQEKIIPGRELVPGDLVILEAGNYVPADVRLVESVNLKVDESILTGESLPVSKEADVVLDREIPLGDRHNSAFMGTVVTYGRGRALVVATGQHTQIGLIAQMLQSTEEEQTPLQKRLDHLGRLLGKLTIIICVVIFVLGLMRQTSIPLIFQQTMLSYLKVYQQEIILLFMTAVSLAIAAVPEGLPAVVTICLALGMQAMAKRKALVRRLPAVETLGCTTVICADKTGTLTENQMTVVSGQAGSRLFSVSGQGYQPEGKFYSDSQVFSSEEVAELKLLLIAAVACSDARLEPSGEEKGKKIYRIIGDPTEAALVVCGAKGGLWPSFVNQAFPRVGEIPFDSERKRMTTVHLLTEEGRKILPEGIGGCAGYIVFVKGAPEKLLSLCQWSYSHSGVQVLTDEERKELLKTNRRMAKQALRILGFACRTLKEKPEEIKDVSLEKDLIFLGLLGMRDPARAEVARAIQEARTAGIRTVMVTGDYQETARAIAEVIGLKRPDGLVVEGNQLSSLTVESLTEIVDRIDVFARVSPQQKTMIVESLKKKGEVVAVTGDGINDAPALKKADIGIAMGITGTDVAKETADLILTDDNYATIVAAVKEGRIIYGNIRKFVFYLISCNIGEILIIFVAMVSGWPLPLRPVQLLWLNLVTDGAPALALGMEKGEPDIMKKKPRPVSEPVITRRMMMMMFFQAVVMAISMLTVFSWSWQTYRELPRAQTVIFATLVLSELFRAYPARSEYLPLWRIGFWTNRWLQYSVGLSLVLLFAVLEIPFLQPVFGTVPLTVVDWQLILPFSLLPALAAELVKFWSRKMYSSK